MWLILKENVVLRVNHAMVWSRSGGRSYGDFAAREHGSGIGRYFARMKPASFGFSVSHQVWMPSRRWS
jgi:hypothetical protein